MTYQHRQWLARYRRYVQAHGLLCQECGGGGGETVPILDDGTGPFEECSWCAGTGLVTRRGRGEWLRYKRQLRKEKLCKDNGLVQPGSW